MKRILLLLGIAFSIISVSAEENVLQTIEIEPIKDTYNIVLTTDRTVDVKKTVQAPNKITLNLKDTRASKTLNTIYNNVSNVDTVMVEPQGNSVNIFFQAENAGAATVSFDTQAYAAAPVVPAKTSKKLKLNNPIESYAPVYKDDFETAKTSSLFDKLKSSSAVGDIKDNIEEASSGDVANKMISGGLFILLTVAVIRLFRRKEPEMKIGLSQSLNEREVDMYKGAQQPITPFAPAAKPFTTVNYGLNAYQRENRNPYESNPMPIHNPRLRNYVTQAPQDTMTQTVSRPQQAATAPQAQAMTQPRKLTTPVNTAPVNQSNPNIDNLKFLESMTAIFEKNGRHDLARGLQSSLSKTSGKTKAPQAGDFTQV